MEHLCHINIYHLKVSNTFSKFNHTVNQNNKPLTLTPTSFLKETCLIHVESAKCSPSGRFMSVILAGS